MRRKLFITLFVIAIACSAAQADPADGAFSLSDGSKLSFRASHISGLGTDKIVLTGGASIKVIKPTFGTSFEGCADKVVILTGQEKNSSAVASVKSADFTGNVKITRSGIDPTTREKISTVGTAKNATYDGTTQLACLSSEVKIIDDGPTAHIVASADKATINLKTKPDPNEERFSLDSSPGLSTVEITPKPKKETRSKN